MKAMRKLSLDTFDPRLHLDRDVSLLAFNARRDSNANRTASEIDELLKNISRECHALVEKQYTILNREILPLLAKNIRVRSIISRFLEQARIYYLRNDLKHDLYLSSADWMAKNLFRRVEVAFPVMDKSLKKRVIEEGVMAYLKDNQNAWRLRSNGTYRQKKSREKQKKYGAQQQLMQIYGAAQTQG